MIYPVILAGGRSIRFNSEKSKVLHNLLGKPIIFYILDILKELSFETIFVISGKNHDELIKSLPPDVRLMEQKVPLGTGDAVRVALDHIESGEIFILPGDAPLLEAETLKKLIEKHTKEGNACTFLTAILEKPTGYGRVIRKNEKPIKIVEEIDATEKEKEIKEVNAGVYLFKTEILKEIILDIKPDNKKGEYYITDCIEILSLKKEKVNTLTLEDPKQMLGINTREDYEKVFKILKERIIKKWMDSGVTIMEKDSVYIESEVDIGKDTVIYPMVYLMGKTKIGKKAKIGPFVTIKDSIINDEEEILGPCVIKSNIKSYILHEVMKEKKKMLD
ncbi:MAG: NTP transferase domain-containing protein [Candidatus Hydrothermales bacterium]